MQTTRNSSSCKRCIIVTGRFLGFHKWPDAPDEVAYLRELHRHEFHYRAEWGVRHNERDIEFHTAKDLVCQRVYELAQANSTNNWSCETWAEKILELTKADAVEVWEDGECGARVERVEETPDTLRKAMEDVIRKNLRVGGILHKV